MVPVHQPAMVEEVLAHLGQLADKTVLDMTVGCGGHAKHLAEAGAIVIGLDRDPEALEIAARTLADYEGRSMLLHGRMSDAIEILAREGIEEIDGCLIDAGISMVQMLDEERGFSAHSEGRLDMRMDRSSPDGLTAQDVVNGYLENDLVRVFANIGKRREARQVATGIVAARKRGPIRTAAQLAELIAARVARGRCIRRIDAAPYLMAIRVEVNNELAELQSGIEAGCCLLSPTGMIATLTWNGAEHQVCRRTLRRQVAPCECPSALPCVCGKTPIMRLVTRKPVYPTAEEVERNPACRSVRLQVAEKLPTTA